MLFSKRIWQTMASMLGLVLFFFPEKNLIGEKDVTREMAFLTNTLKKTVQEQLILQKNIYISWAVLVRFRRKDWLVCLAVLAARARGVKAQIYRVLDILGHLSLAISIIPYSCYFCPLFVHFRLPSLWQMVFKAQS